MYTYQEKYVPPPIWAVGGGIVWEPVGGFKWVGWGLGGWMACTVV